MATEEKKYVKCKKCSISMRLLVSQTEDTCSVCRGINTHEEDSKKTKKKRKRK